MRRSITTYMSVPASMPRRAATVLAIPTLHHVEKSLSGLELTGSRPEDRGPVDIPVDKPVDKPVENSNYPAFAGIRYSALPGSADAEIEEINSSQEAEHQADEAPSPGIHDITLERTASSSSEYEADLEDACSGDGDTFDTSANDSSLHDFVHKPLKDLIFRTNKEIYDVDSNRVKYKVGLSKKVPCLHPNRRINGASPQ